MAPLQLAVGLQVYIHTKSFRTTHPSCKLAEKNLGLFTVLEQVGRQSYRIKLPDMLRAVHPVFHISQLELSHPNPFPDRIQSPPPPVDVEGELEYEIAEILDSKLDRRRRPPLMYLVQWLGYEGDDATSWLPAVSLVHAQQAVDDFHAKYPTKPGPLIVTHRAT